MGLATGYISWGIGMITGKFSIVDRVGLNSFLDTWKVRNGVESEGWSWYCGISTEVRNQGHECMWGSPLHRGEAELCELRVRDKQVQDGTRTPIFKPQR